MNGCWIADTPIAVDFWKPLTCPAKFFFLTHMHADHTCGMSSSWKDKIYCSELSAKLLKAKFDVKDDLIFPLTMGVSHIISIDVITPITMTVTLIDAHHCPGAVMFLFEGYFGTFLYTGDFRFCEAMLPDLDVIKGKTVDRLYIDNTYNSPEFVFPSRAEANKLVLQVIEENENSLVVIGLFNLGKEDLLVSIAKYFQTWIVVSPEKMEQIQLLNLPDVFTTDFNAGWIRVEKKNKVNKYNVSIWNREIRTVAVLPTALFISSQLQQNNFIFTVPYSDHCSYPELLQFVSHVRPRKIIPIVKNGDKYAKTNITDFQKYECFLDKTPSHSFSVPEIFCSKSTPVSTGLCVKNHQSGLKRKHSVGVEFYDSPEKDKMPKLPKLNEDIPVENIENKDGKEQNKLNQEFNENVKETEKGSLKNICEQTIKKTNFDKECDGNNIEKQKSECDEEYDGNLEESDGKHDACDGECDVNTGGCNGKDRDYNDSIYCDEECDVNAEVRKEVNRECYVSGEYAGECDVNAEVCNGKDAECNVNGECIGDYDVNTGVCNGKDGGSVGSTSGKCDVRIGVCGKGAECNINGEFNENCGVNAGVCNEKDGEYNDSGKYEEECDDNAGLCNEKDGKCNDSGEYNGESNVSNGECNGKYHVNARVLSGKDAECNVNDAGRTETDVEFDGNDRGTKTTMKHDLYEERKKKTKLHEKCDGNDINLYDDEGAKNINMEKGHYYGRENKNKVNENYSTVTKNMVTGECRLGQKPQENKKQQRKHLEQLFSGKSESYTINSNTICSSRKKRKLNILHFFKKDRSSVGTKGTSMKCQSAANRDNGTIKKLQQCSRSSLADRCIVKDLNNDQETSNPVIDNIQVESQPSCSYKKSDIDFSRTEKRAGLRSYEEHRLYEKVIDELINSIDISQY